MNESWAIMITGAFLGAICISGFSAMGVFVWWMHGKIVWLIEGLTKVQNQANDIQKDVDSLMQTRLDEHEHSCKNFVSKHKKETKEEETTSL